MVFYLAAASAPKSDKRDVQIKIDYPPLNEFILIEVNIYIQISLSKYN